MKRLKPAIKVFKTKKFKKASEALAFAKSIISKPGRWVQDNFAVSYDFDQLEDLKLMSFGDLSINVCEVKSKNAEAFCALGAVQFVNGPAQKQAEKFLREAAAVVSRNKKTDPDYQSTNNDIFEVNDLQGFEDTKKMFTIAIRNARKAGN